LRSSTRWRRRCVSSADRATRTAARAGGAKNIEAEILGHPPTPFVFKTLGQLATIGHRTGVAIVFGIKFSGFIAWCLWRMVYLVKLPRLAKKLRVISGWTLELLFSREIEQIITLRDVEELTSRMTRIRARSGSKRLNEVC
jgi:NADH:ubiquinone reductase (H+-translocating)